MDDKQKISGVDTAPTKTDVKKTDVSAPTVNTNAATAAPTTRTIELQVGQVAVGLVNNNDDSFITTAKEWDRVYSKDPKYVLLQEKKS